MSYLLALLVAAAVFVGYLTLTRQAARTARSDARIAQLAEAAPVAYAQEGGYSLEDQASGSGLLFESVLNGIGTDVQGLYKTEGPRLAQAGIGSYNGFLTYLFLKRIGLPLLALVLLIPLFLSFRDPAVVRLMKVGLAIAMAMVILLGVKGADIFVKNQEQKRKQALTRAFPDTLDLLLVCVESGLALDGALARVTRELGRAYPEITEELNRTRLELTLLNDRTAALQNLADRTDLVPFRSLVSALIQTEKFGTSLSDTLRVMSVDYRQTRLMEAENKAGRLPALMTVPMIILMLPAFLMIIIAPPIIRVSAQGGLFGNSAEK